MHSTQKILSLSAILLCFELHPSWGQEAPDFVAIGRPFLEKHCIGCHGSEEPKAELSLNRFQDSMSLVRERKLWENVLKMTASGEMPPEDHPRPTPAESEAFIEHVHALFDHADRNAKPDPGRVTMRRLNRVEYRNTIRDLIGIDFDPTEDFPSDDIGHGFDNIGDVLTLSPVLMERYLAAAERIVERAIMPELPPTLKRHISARHTEPASGDVEKKLMEGEFRRMTSDGTLPIEVGPINTPYQWDSEGEYTFKTRAYAKSNEDQAVRIAIVVQGKGLTESSSEEELAQLVGKVRSPAKILQILEVSGRDSKSANVFKVSLPAMEGRDRMMVALMKPNEGSPPIQVYVDHLALEGPMDTRPASQRRLLAKVDPEGPSQQTAKILERFLLRAYRRPPTETELQRMMGLVEATQANGKNWEAGMQLAFQSALSSPKFLFRVELDDRPQSIVARGLDEFQLASRISYFLWSSMPDDELLALAGSNELSENIDVQVRRMLKDSKSSSLVTQFALQWLQIQRLASYSPDPKLFPQFDEKLRGAMRKETELFFESILKEDRSILDLIDADYTFLNETLARHYGIVDTAGTRTGEKREDKVGQRIRGDKFERVTLQSGERGGLLTQASILAVTSNPTRTSPVKRGRWVLEQILGAPPPPPPPNAPLLEEGEQAKATGTLKERLEAHRKNPSCANCHAKMDPIGFALENFDAVGAYRTKDGEFSIDATGQLADGTLLDGPTGLKKVIRERKQQFERCLVEKMLIYALGRGIEYYDRPSIDRIVNRLASQEDRISVLVTEIIKSDPFRMRRASDETASIK